MSEGQRTAALQRLCAIIGNQVDNEQTDGQLLERYAIHREQAAFTALVRRHGPMVFGLCRRVLRDHHEAEDAFQATFLVLVRKAASLDRRRPLGNWLYTIAYHAALKTRSGVARRLQREIQVARTDCIEPRDEAASSEVRALLDAEMNRLPEKYRAPLVLCYLQGRTNEEAALELGWPSGTVKGRLARARNLLRDRLTRRGLALSLALLGTALAEQCRAASLPSGLIERTVETASAFAGKSLSSSPATIAQGVIQAMLFAKLKTMTFVLMASMLLATGLGWLMLQGHAESATTTLPAADQLKDKEDALPKVAEMKGQRLSLEEVKAGNAFNDGSVDRPAVTLGVIQPVKKTEIVVLSDAFLANRLTITNPQAGQLTSLIVVSPELNT